MYNTMLRFCIVERFPLSVGIGKTLVKQVLHLDHGHKKNKINLCENVVSVFTGFH